MNINVFDDGCIIYTLYIFILMFFAIASFYLKPKINFIIFLLLCFLGCLIGGLRPIDVGVDTNTYLRIIENIYNDGSNFSDVLFGRTRYLSDLKDPLAWAILFLFYELGGEWLFLMAPQIIFWGITTLFISRITKYWTFMLFMLVFMRYHEFYMAGFRQSVAIVLCMLAYMFFIGGKNIKAGFSLLLSTFFHFSSIVYLIVPFLNRISLIRFYKTSVLMLCLSPFFALLALNVMSSLGLRFGVYSYDGGSNYRWLIICLFLFMYCVMKLFKVSIGDNNLIFNMAYFAVFVAAMSLVTVLGFRLSLYFGFFIPILVCRIMEEQADNRVIDVLLLSTCMIIIYVITGVPVGMDNYYISWC